MSKWCFYRQRDEVSGGCHCIFLHHIYVETPGLCECRGSELVVAEGKKSARKSGKRKADRRGIDERRLMKKNSALGLGVSLFVYMRVLMFQS